MSTETPALPTIPFPTLPLELREEIYRYAILPEDPKTYSRHLSISFSAADSAHGEDKRYLHWLPNLCRVNEATRIEVSLFLLRITEFSIMYAAQVPSFVRFLDTFPHNSGFLAIRRLDFQLFSRHQPIDGEGNMYIDFMRRCPNLTQVRIKIEVGHLTRGSCDWSKALVMPPETLWVFHQDRIRELDDLVAMYRFEGLLELESLNRLGIEVWPRVRVTDCFGMENVLIDCMPLIERLAQWSREGYGVKDRKVEVKVVEASSPGLRWYARSVV
jgi:hypothetical protein